jgi:hypothetical protein
LAGRISVNKYFFVFVFIFYSKKYLLYNNHTEDFRTAIEMLNWNVVHLCISQNIVIPVEAHEQTLKNLLAVLRSPKLGM